MHGFADRCLASRPLHHIRPPRPVGRATHGISPRAADPAVRVSFPLRGGDGIRTRVNGFAGRCLTSRPLHPAGPKPGRSIHPDIRPVGEHPTRPLTRPPDPIRPSSVANHPPVSGDPVGLDTGSPAPGMRRGPPPPGGAPQPVPHPGIPSARTRPYVRRIPQDRHRPDPASDRRVDDQPSDARSCGTAQCSAVGEAGESGNRRSAFSACTARSVVSRNSGRVYRSRAYAHRLG